MSDSALSTTPRTTVHVAPERVGRVHVGEVCGGIGGGGSGDGGDGDDGSGARWWW